MAKKPKAEAAEVAHRVEEVLRIRLDGAQFHDVVQYAAEKGWGLKERQVRNYVRRADDLLVERQDRKRRRVIARHVAQREALYARAVNAADYRTALAVLADEAKLRGLYRDKELKGLVKLAAAQGARIRELEELQHGRGDGRVTFDEMKRVARAAIAEAVAAQRASPGAGPAAPVPDGDGTDTGSTATGGGSDPPRAAGSGPPAGPAES